MVTEESEDVPFGWEYIRFTDEERERFFAHAEAGKSNWPKRSLHLFPSGYLERLLIK